MKTKHCEIPITRKLLNRVFVVYLLLTVFLTANELYTEYVHERAELVSNFETLRKFIGPALGDALIHHSEKRVQYIMEGVMQGPAITGVIVEPKFNYKTFASGDVTLDRNLVLREKLALHTQRTWYLWFAKPIERIFPLYDKDGKQLLANVTVYTNRSIIIAKFFDIYALIIINELIKAILLWFFILWVGQKILSRPLEKLTRATLEMAKGNSAKVSLKKYKKSTELDVLAESFNTMVDKIQTAQTGLMHTKRHLADIIDAMPSALLAITIEGVVTDCNLQAQKMTQVDRKKAIGMQYTDLLPLLKNYQDVLVQVISKNQAEKVQNILIQEKTGRRYVDIILYPLLDEDPPGIVIRLDDITSQVKIQEKLLKQEKLQSTLKLASGIAHEINNPLGAVLQGVQTVKRRLSSELDKNKEVAEGLQLDLQKLIAYCDSREIFKFLESIQLSGEQAAKVIATLLDFTPRAEVNYQPYSLEKIIERALSHLPQDPLLRKTQLLNQITFDKQYAADLPDIKCQPLEIERVLLGILKNAVQATEATQNERPPEVIISTYTENGWVGIDIEDNGIGMNDEEKSHLFELFFTTKGVGIGTGLDLAMAYHIIKVSHQGKIKVDSVKGRGTKVTIQFPQVLVKE
ncbi:MAG: ATP-binding protein [Legionellales bacterium]|jgi:PAS domain S-box-containing protein